MSLRIAITGPESCGKTSLAKALADYLKVDFISEYSREYLLERNGKYQFEDLVIIAQEQKKRIDAASAEKIIIADTEMLVMYIWSHVVYGKADSFIEEELKKQKFDLYILCDTDVEWEYDPLRENEYDRDDLFRRYYKKLRELKWNFIVVNGPPEKRLVEALKKIENLRE